MRIGEIGVSNVAVRARVTVTVKRGRMLVLVDDEPSPVDVMIHLALVDHLLIGVYLLPSW